MLTDHFDRTLLAGPGVRSPGALDRAGPDQRAILAIQAEFDRSATRSRGYSVAEGVGTRAEFATMLKSEVERTQKIIKDAKIKAE